MSEQSWYFTQNGERKGPVAVDVVQNALKNGRLDPQKDLVWGPGLENWKPIIEVPELEVDVVSPPEPPTQIPQKPAPKPQAQAQPVNPYEAPNSLDDDDELSKAMAERRAQSYPGMGRLMYWFAPTAFYIIVVVACSAIASATSMDGKDTLPLMMSVGGIVTLVLCLFATFSRLTNLGMSRWNFLWSFVPIMSIWLSYRLYVCPAGYHDHKKLDTPGKVVLILYVISLLAVIAIFTSVLFTGASYYKKAAEEAQRKIEAEKARTEQVK